MKIYVAKNGGFCKGVKNAVDTAMIVSPENTYILGELVHNPEVVENVKKRGIITVNSISDVPSCAKVLIRSHGVGKAVFDECKQRNIEVIDCTCPFVKRIQNIVSEHYSNGETIVLIGEKTHPEVVGINGWCNNEAIIFSEDENDFSCLPTDKKICLVAQTTCNNKKFDKIIKNIQNKYDKTVEVFCTICYTTIGRQSEAENIAKKCDAVLVLGGANSSNTNKLFDICSEFCKNVYRMQSVDDLEKNKIKCYKNVGIITGASTPNAQTQEVLLKMEMTEAKAMMDEVVANMDNQPKLKKGQIVTVTVSAADDSGVAVLLPSAKKEIMLDKADVDCEEYDKTAFVSGDEIEVMVVALNPVKLSQKMIKAVKEEEAMLEDIKAGKEFSITCTGSNKGGLTGNIGTYTVFVPAREIRSGFVKDLEKYVGKKLRLKVLEIKNERRKEIIASQRTIIEEEKAAKEAAKAAKEAEFFANINVDDVVEGKVERVTNFGAFVSVNGFDCLAHISDLSWTGVKAVTDVLEIGKKYQFKVLKLDPEAKKVSIGYKQLQAQPWELAAEKYVEGDVIHGKVVRIVPFGAFVEVEKGIDGLVHVSQISHEFLENPTTALTIGQEIDAKILKLDCEAKKMTLSIKALEPKPEVEKKAKAVKTEEEGEVKSKKPRKEKVSDEMTEWNEGGLGGASIADLLNMNS